MIDKILEYKRYKEAAVKMAEMEAIRMLMVRRGNLQKSSPPSAKKLVKELKYRPLRYSS
ncbi:hypothetical protein [Paraflavitalea speifideaquila]|uniref:hypothetical protein n=1 Tax=Paraflavitalea speifideaquila TaxID=3076558 RepID=UPI0028E37784|nr:hypothetical protein [Paraflavitalea speifideiaquila]